MHDVFTAQSTREISRNSFFAEKVVIVDGQFGCGKTMLAPIVAALDRVELLTYAYELEYVCELRHLGKISDDAAIAMVRMLTDLQLYNTMMSRETNFRPSDLSSALRSPNRRRYIKRLFLKGDEFTPARIVKEKPILHLTTHNLVPISEPVCAALGERVVLVEVVRHPLYMIKQQTLNMDRLHGDVRDFTIYYKYGNHELPFFVEGWEEQYLRANSVERAIYYIEHMTKWAEATKARLTSASGANIITVPFECFVFDPWPFLDQITWALSSRVTRTTRRMLKKQNVPRKKYAEGIALKIYKRCGWEPAKPGASEEEEFAKRRMFAVKSGASTEALQVLDRLSAGYEESYLRFAATNS